MQQDSNACTHQNMPSKITPRSWKEPTSFPQSMMITQQPGMPRPWPATGTIGTIIWWGFPHKSHDHSNGFSHWPFDSLRDQGLLTSDLPTAAGCEKCDHRDPNLPTVLEISWFGRTLMKMFLSVCSHGVITILSFKYSVRMCGLVLTSH